MNDDSTSRPMAPFLKLAVAVYIAALNFALMAILIKVWPVALTTTSPSPGYLSPEGRYFITAATTGALGSYIHLATSFVDYAGNRTLVHSWGWWYFLRPSIGATLALVVYFVLRAGLITGAGDSATANLSPFGIAAISALSGMFSKQATEKLRDVFEHICATQPTRDATKS